MAIRTSIFISRPLFLPALVKCFHTDNLSTTDVLPESILLFWWMAVTELLAVVGLTRWSTPRLPQVHARSNNRSSIRKLMSWNTWLLVQRDTQTRSTYSEATCCSICPFPIGPSGTASQYAHISRAKGHAQKAASHTSSDDRY